MIFNYERDQEITVTLTKGELYDARMAVMKTANREAYDNSPTGVKYVEKLDALEEKIARLLFVAK